MTDNFFNDFDQMDDKRLREIEDKCKRDIDVEYESLKTRLIFIFIGMGIVGAMAAAIDWFFWPPVRMREWAIEWLGGAVVIFGIPAYCSTLLRVGELRVRAQLRGQLTWYTGHLREELKELKNDLLSEIQSRAIDTDKEIGVNRIEGTLDAIKPEHLDSRLDRVGSRLEPALERRNEQLESCIRELKSDLAEELREQLTRLASSVERDSWELGWMLDSVRRLQRIQDDLLGLRAWAEKATFAESEGAGQDEELVRSNLIWRLDYIGRKQLDCIRLPYCGRDEYGNRFEGIGIEGFSMVLEQIQQTMLEIPHGSLGQVECIVSEIEKKLEEQRLRDKERSEEKNRL